MPGGCLTRVSRSPSLRILVRSKISTLTSCICWTVSVKTSSAAASSPIPRRRWGVRSPHKASSRSSGAPAFKENANDMAIGLREAFVKVETVSVKEDLQKRFRDHLRRLAPDTAVLDPQQLRSALDSLVTKIKEEFELKLKPWRMPGEEEAEVVKDFHQQLLQAVQQRVVVNDQQVEGGMLKLMAAPVVGTGGYFLLAHHILLYLVMGGVVYVDANKHAQREGVDTVSDCIEVLNGVWEDTQKWGIQRWRARNSEGIPSAVSGWGVG
ncbi:unnamed protein product [Durusdinium trenchii]|uniref:Uncharacterized protein n=1 Tax=Durusdinium trenchii TaxID=1381693 RepID=A0ABP0LCB0_9DINO